MFDKARCFEFLRTRRKLFIWSLAFILLFNFLFGFVASHWGFYITREGQECFSWKYWFVEKNKKPGKGEYAAFRGKDIPNFQDGVVWVKKIIGEEGDSIAVREFGPSETYRERVYVNGLPRDFQVRGQVHIYDREEKLVTGFDVFSTDSKGKALPMIASGVIPSGKYYVMATAKRSYDSRYWGLLDEKNIIGKAHPLF